MVFWHPKGWIVWQQIEQYMRQKFVEYGYQEVRTPQVMDRSLWEKSGHWDNYRDNMFTTASEDRDYAVKPMNCPGHVQIFNSGLKSYRDLPLRMAEFGVVPPQRALGRAARPDAGARLHPGRRPHLLHRGPDRGGGGRLHRHAAEGLRRLRLQRRAGQAVDPAGQARRLGRVLGQGGSRAGGGAGQERPGLRPAAGRGRVLRPQDRVHAEGHARPRCGSAAPSSSTSTCRCASAPNSSTRTTAASPR